MDDPCPELSIIVPVLDEAATLAELFRTLGDQEGIEFELILSDGGSMDGTPAVAQILARQYTFHCRLVQTGCGRGRQMNAGAVVAIGNTLLFLHADSQFADPSALRKGLAALQARLNDRGDERAAGRFSLRFRRGDPRPSLSYYFHECKARLDRPGCIHGDQGFLLRRSFFTLVGPFDESLSIFEDDRLADKVRSHGEWLLLPAEIFTSTRRFETEGLRQRQILNAMLMNFAAIGSEDFLTHVRDLYRLQSRTVRLQLYPIFAAIDKRLDDLRWRHRLQLWLRTGAFVRNNAWQLAFVLDIRRNFRSRLPPGAGKMPVLAFFNRWIEPLSVRWFWSLIAAGLTCCWFHASRAWMRWR